jgi:hypothetical protein
MRSYCDKKIFFVFDGFIYRAEIAADVYATIRTIFALEGVITEKGIERIFDKYIKPLFEFIFFGAPQLKIVPFKIAMEKDLHKRL